MTEREPARYETLGVIGRGGMATVFVGRARGAGGFARLVAIKRAHRHVRDDAALAASMKREAGLVARLHHPNIVRVIDVVVEDEDLVLVLDYVEGGSLSELLARAAAGGLVDGRARVRVFVRVLLDAAAGLDAAHHAVDDDGAGLGVVHRDVSPSNVLVGTDGIARLTDFGIAKTLEGSSELTETGALKGKIAYMAPEYIEHQRADAASDQFSFGVVVWEALAGQRLFRGPTEIETLKRVVSARVPALSSVEAVLAPLDAVVARALARSSSDRFPNVRELAAALEARARSADLVASHAEVAGFVQRALQAELDERRKQLRNAPERALASPGASRDDTVREGRDELATGSMVPLARRPARRMRRPAVVGSLLVVLAVGAALATRAQLRAGAGVSGGVGAEPLARSASSVAAPGPQGAGTSSGAPGVSVAPVPPMVSASPPLDSLPPSTRASAAAASPLASARGSAAAPRRTAPSVALTALTPAPTAPIPAASTAASAELVPRKAPPNPYLE